MEISSKRVRAYLGGELVVDTTRPRLVWEVPYEPAYYLPVEDLRAELVTSGRVRPVALPADACHWNFGPGVIAGIGLCLIGWWARDHRRP